MKTSNRILLIFIINIFLIPVCLFMGFSTMIRNENFKLVSNKGDGKQSGSFRDVHTVRLVASDRELICNLSYGDSSQYDYDRPLYGDSISVFSAGDTLFIKYTGTEKIEHGMHINARPVTINLRLPQLSNLVIEDGLVNVLSLDTAKTKQVRADVSGSGILNLGGVELQDEDEKNVAAPKTLLLDQLSFFADNGNLQISQGVRLRSLQLQVKGNSTIQIKDDAVVKELKGMISDSTQIGAKWETIKRIQSLTNQ